MSPVHIPRQMEVEAKFAAPDRHLLERLAGEPRLAGMRLSAPKTIEVHDTYLDTEDGAVAAAGYAWRVRDVNGAVTTTLKALAKAEGPMHRREEIEIAGGDPPAGWPEGSARDLGISLTGGAALKTLVVLTQRRTSRVVRKGSRAVAEMSLDEVVARCGERSDQYCEVEVELRDGTEADLTTIITALRNEWGLSPESRSKYERAAALRQESPPLLTGDERRLCQRLADRRDLHGRRARALLALDGGGTQVRAGTIARMSERRVRYWLATFRARRMGVFPRRVLAGLAPACSQDSSLLGATPESGPAVTPPSPAASDRAGITPLHTMAEAARLALAVHFDRMRAHEAGVRRDEDPEELHDMRVATRRMRAAFLVYEDAFERDEVAHLRKGLRRTGRALGAVRDLDVFWQKTSRYLESLPPERRGELASLHAAWKEERSLARQRLIAQLDGPRYRQMIEAFQRFLRAPGAAEPPPFRGDGTPRPRRVGHVLPMIVYRRVAAVTAFDEWLPGPTISLPLLHRLRIAAKALRYTLEFFVEVLGPETKPLIAQMKRLQDDLGDIQDDVVAVTLLRDFLTWGTWRHREGAHAPTEPVLAPGVAAYLASRQRDLAGRLEGFPLRWAEFVDHSFARRIAAALTLREQGERDAQD